MPALLACAAVGFAGFSLLLPAAPMWAVRIGADSLGAGAVNSVLMLFTVIAQLLVGWLLRRVGWAGTQALGLVLLGIPAVAHLLTGSLWQVLLLAALRGLGFGILTVCSVRGIAALIPQERRGRAIGAYGLSIAAPQFVLTPLAPWLAENVGYQLVFTLAAVPLLAVPLAFTRPAPTLVHEPHTDRLDGVGAGLVGPIGALVVITAAGGGILTFAPQLSGATTALGALLAMTGTAALARWLIGGIADHHGAARFIGPMLGVGAAGLAVIAVGIGMAGSLVILGAALLGTAYGALQNLTLVQAFAASGEHARGAVSVAWNVGFDAGTGLGSLAVGALATSFSFPTAFAVMTAACVAVGLVWVLMRHDGQSGRGTTA
ncbi:transporter [Mycobacterium vulneris]|nr:transporter [Mycolicibacterium vulneris]OCB62253.1 transporter [Mycolicibacterium vulneris]